MDTNLKEHVITTIHKYAQTQTKITRSQLVSGQYENQQKMKRKKEQKNHPNKKLTQAVSFSTKRHYGCITGVYCVFPPNGITGVYCVFPPNGITGVYRVFPPNGITGCLLYTSPSPRDRHASRMPSSA